MSDPEKKEPGPLEALEITYEQLRREAQQAHNRTYEYFIKMLTAAGVDPSEFHKVKLMTNAAPSNPPVTESIIIEWINQARSPGEVMAIYEAAQQWAARGRTWTINEFAEAVGGYGKPVEPELVLGPFYGLRFFRLHPLQVQSNHTSLSIEQVEDRNAQLGLYALAGWTHGFLEPWQPGWNEAVCTRKDANHSGHECGFHGCESLDELKLAYGSGNRIDVDTAPVAIIELKGRVELHNMGFRAQFARVVALAVPRRPLWSRVQVQVQVFTSAESLRRPVEFTSYLEPLGADRQCREELSQLYDVPVFENRNDLQAYYLELKSREGTGDDS